MAAAFIRLQLLEAIANASHEAEMGRRSFRKRKDPFLLEEEKFIKLYRLNKRLAQNLINELAPHIKDSSRSSAISKETKVFAALRFYAGGPNQTYVGEEEFTCMEQSSVSRCIDEVSMAITNHLFPRWISLELSRKSVGKLQEEFLEKYGFPGCIGAIDGTHVAIVTPPFNHPIYKERDYLNHNNYHSINVQLVSDTSMRILYANARYPGETDDAFIYSYSELRKGLLQMQREFQPNAWLIGDSGYPLESCILTPVSGDVQPDSPQDRYNKCLCRARSVVERCNALLRTRWRCLSNHQPLHYMPERASKIIYACCVLHNMCIEENLPPPEDGKIHEDKAIMHIEEQTPHPDGIIHRDRIIRQYFS